MGNSFWLKLAVLCIVLGLSASAIGGKAIPIRVVYWADHVEDGIIKRTVASWSKGHRDIKIILEPVKGNEYQAKLLTQIAAGQAPDVIYSGASIFYNLASKDVFLPLNGLVATDTNLAIDDFYPESVDMFSVDGTIYGIPRDVTPIACIYYNKFLFDREGIPYPKDDWNTDDLLALAKILTKVGTNGNVVEYGFLPGWFWPNFIFAFGSGWVDNAKKPAKLMLDSVGGREGLKFYHDLMWVHGVSPRPGALDVDSTELFAQGKAAMYMSGIWEVARFRSISAFDWDVAMFPKTPSGKRNFMGSCSGFGISSTTRYPREAWEVLKCMVSQEVQIKFAEADLSQPSIMSLSRGAHFSQDGRKPLNKGMLDEAVKYMVGDPFSNSLFEIEYSVIYPVLDEYWLDRLSLEGTLEKIDREIREKDLKVSDQAY